MGCNTIRMPGGGTGIICTGRTRAKPCQWCGSRSSLLCDFPVVRNGKASTCNAPMCGSCGRPVGENLDYCPPHYRHAEKTKTLPASAPKLFE
jgi:hypothetical protein